MSRAMPIQGEANLLALLAALDGAGAPRDDSVRGVDFVTRGGLLLAEVRLPDGTTIFSRQGVRGDPTRTTPSSVAAGLCEAAGIVAPMRVELPSAWAERHGIEIFRRPSHATMAELWPTLAPAARERAIRSLGELILRVRDIGLDEVGDGYTPVRIVPLQWELAHDLGVRLFPAVADVWPTALGTVESLLETIPEVAARTALLPASSVRFDVAPDCVLCEGAADDVRCVGFALPPTIGTAPLEWLSARVGVFLRGVRGESFGGAAPGALFGDAAEAADPVLVSFFAGLELLDLGLAAARAGEPAKAEKAFADAAVAIESVHVAYEERVRRQARSAGLSEPELAAMLPRQGGHRDRWKWLHPIRAARARLHRKDDEHRAGSGPDDREERSP